MSTYNPYKQGRKDGKEEKFPHPHRSHYNAAEYARGYTVGEAEREKEDAARRLEPTVCAACGHPLQ